VQRGAWSLPSGGPIEEQGERLAARRAGVVAGTPGLLPA